MNYWTKELLVLQMKRALEILERKEELKTYKPTTCGTYVWNMVDREVTELNVMLREIRRNSVKLQKEIRGADNE